MMMMMMMMITINKVLKRQDSETLEEDNCPKYIFLYRLLRTCILFFYIRTFFSNFDIGLSFHLTKFWNCGRTATCSQQFFSVQSTAWFTYF